MSDGVQNQFGLPGVDQIGYVVKDIDASMPFYESLFGPFEIYEANLEGAFYRGDEIDCKLKIATNNSGPVEIELIEVLEGETPHTEHLREHGEGPQHIRFKIENVEAKIAELEAAGYKNIFFKRFSPTVAFSYLECPKEMGGRVVELLEMP